MSIENQNQDWRRFVREKTAQGFEVYQTTVSKLTKQLGQSGE